VNLAELRAAQPELLHSAARLFARAGQALARVVDRLELEVLQPLMDGSWTGDANQAAVAYIMRLWKSLDMARAGLEKVDRAVWQLAEAVVAAQQMVKDAESIVESADLLLGEDGSIRFPPFPMPTSEQDVQIRQQAAEQAHQILTEALTAATEADVTCAQVLADLAAEHAGTTAGEAGGGGAGSESSGDDDGGFFDSPLWDALSWTSSISSFVEANWGIGGLGAVPGVGHILTGVSGVGAVTGVADLIDQGNPVEAYQERGAEYVADGFETAFNASSVAFAVAPDPISKLVAGAAVVGTGIGWAVSDNWNSIPFHDNVEDATEWTIDRAEEAWDFGGDVAGEAWDTGGDIAGEAWDTGGDLVSTISDHNPLPWP
jgi:hypothetical protein